MTARQWQGRTLPRGAAFQIDRRTGRTREIYTGEFIPDTGKGSKVSEETHRAAAVTARSEDHYCMLDSGANVMVISWKEGMKGDHTVCG